MFPEHVTAAHLEPVRTNALLCCGHTVLYIWPLMVILLQKLV